MNKFPADPIGNQHPETARLGAREKIALLALLLLGAVLRFGGMSHDLHEGQVYHPDIPKQIHAMQRFAAGVYYQHIGKPDYDGYPLFHAHLVEYLVRIVEPARQGLLALLGVPFTKGAALDTFALFWITLAMNATLSTLAILVVFRIGRENFSPGVAWLAAAFQAVSPIEVTAAHLATGDATTAFCTVLSLLFAFRIYRWGRYRDYVVAAAIATCGFAAKYYAAMVFFTILAAHLARTGRPASWFGAPSLRRLAVTAAAAVAALFLAIPSLFGHFGAEMNDILFALFHSSQRVPVELGPQPALWRIALFSQRVNLPVLARLLGPAVVPAILLGFATRLRRDPRFWILLIGPIAYWVFGVGSRAMVQPVYHAVATAPLYILAAFCVAAIWRRDLAWARTVRAVTTVVVVAGLVVLAEDSLRELFFQWHMDTRRMGSAWVAENVPRSFVPKGNRYAFDLPQDETAGSTPAGTLYIRSALDKPPDMPADAIALKKFLLERFPLTQFRNVQEETFLLAPKLIRPGFSIPAGPRWPSQTDNQVIFENGPEFVRSEKLFVLSAGERVGRWVVTEMPLREAWIVSQGAAVPARVSVSFGGKTRKRSLGAAATDVFHVDRPRPRFPSGNGLFFYRLRIDGSTAPVRITLATRPGAAGRMLFAAGRYADAAPLLDRAAREDGDPAAAAQALIAARIVGAGAGATTAAAVPPGELAARAGRVTDDDSFFAAYGIRAAYLDALPFLSLSPEELESNGFNLLPPKMIGRKEVARDLVPLPSLWARHLQKGYKVWTAELMLDPGHYRVSVRLRVLRNRPVSGELRAILTDAGETVTLAERRLTVPAPDERGGTLGEFDLVVPPGIPAVRLIFKAAHPPNLAIGGLEIRPDSLANARALAATLQAAVSGDSSAAAIIAKLTETR